MNSEIPLVSVICTTYNHGSYVKQALDGFVMQRCNFPLEVIVHDDASTDNTATIIREYTAKYPFIRAILQTENQYSKGINIWDYLFTKEAKGKYIALCEGDDYWTDPDKLQKQVDFMETYEDVSMCFHSTDIIYENQKRVDNYLFKDLEEREYSANEILKNWTVPTASVMFQTRFAKNIKHDQRFVFGDIIVFLSMAQCGKIFCLGDKMSVYRRLESGIVLSYKGDISSAIKRINHYEAIKEHFINVDRKIINDLSVCYYVTLFFSYLAKLNYKSLLFAYKGIVSNPILFAKFIYVRTLKIPILVMKKKYKRGLHSELS